MRGCGRLVQPSPLLKGQLAGLISLAVREPAIPDSVLLSAPKRLVACGLELRPTFPPLPLLGSGGFSATLGYRSLGP